MATDRSTASWGDTAINAFVNLTPSAPWAIRVAEQWKGLPFGKYLQQGPRRRARALTGPIDPSQESLWSRWQLFGGAEAEVVAYEQAGSAFISKLPLDVRMLVYEMLLSGSIFHIESATPQSRIYHVVCKRPEEINAVNHQCHDLTKRPSSAPREEYREASGLLALLATCRRVYSESIHLLYSTNTFQFTSNHAAFRFLKVLIPSHRVRSVRHFRMIMRLPHHPHMNSRSKRDWNQLWYFFATEMTGLQSLYLRFLVLHDTQEAIRHSTDMEGAEWVNPMVSAAVAMRRERGCRVEIVTGSGEAQDLGTIFTGAMRSGEGSGQDEALQNACVEVHRRIQDSFGGRG